MKGFEFFGEEGETDVTKELLQLHNMKTRKPHDAKKLTRKQKTKRRGTTGHQELNL